MKILLKSFYVFGLLFWIAFLIYGLGRLAAYNAFGKYYSFTCTNAVNFTITEDTNDNLKISYSYDVLGKVYTNDETIADELFRQKKSSASVLPICYNDTYPSLSYIQEVNLAVSREETGVVVSLIFIAFLSIIYLYAKKDYWARKYRTFIKKLSSKKEPA